MEEKIRKILHSHWHYQTQERNWKIYFNDGTTGEVETEFVKDILIHKFKEFKTKYDSLYATERTARLASKHQIINEIQEIRELLDRKVIKWMKMWDRLTSKYQILDAKETKAGLSAESVLRYYGKEIKNKRTKCIAHTDEHPSMHVYEDSVYCFSCGYAGDVIDIVMRLENIDFHSALRRLAELK